MGKSILLILAVTGLLLIGGLDQPAQAGHYYYNGSCGTGYYTTGYTPYYTGYSGYYYSPTYTTYRPVYHTGYTPGYSTWYTPTYSAWYPNYYWYGGYDDDWYDD